MENSQYDALDFDDWLRNIAFRKCSQKCYLNIDLLKDQEWEDQIEAVSA